MQHGAERPGQGAPRLLQMVLVTTTQVVVFRGGSGNWRRDYVVQGAWGREAYTHMAWGWDLNAACSSRIRLFSGKRACSNGRVKSLNIYSRYMLVDVSPKYTGFFIVFPCCFLLPRVDYTHSWNALNLSLGISPPRPFTCREPHAFLLFFLQSSSFSPRSSPQLFSVIWPLKFYI